MPMTPREDAPAALATPDPLGDPAPELEPVPAYQQLAAKEFAERLGSRRRTAGAPVRTIFVSDEQVERPPLSSLLSSAESGGGGRGGQLRAKLYLSLLWVCAKEPYDVSRPARAWAALLGLPDHDDGGVRRIQQALRDLDQRRFISLEDRGGLPSRVVMRSEKGDGGPFVPAPDAYHSLSRDAPDAVTYEHRYFRVPSSLWTDGHIARLKGPSLGMLLALLSERRGQASPAVWFSPTRAKERFGFSTSTRREGLQHLRDLGLVVTKTKVVSEQGAYIDWARRRSVHEVVGL